ncbi:MAG TPA: TolC family protein [Vicinamibacterales bacterium]
MSTVLALSAPVALLAQTTQDDNAKSSTDHRIDEIVRQAAERFAAGGDIPAATAQAGAPFNVSLDDAVRLALEHNLDIQVERLNPQTFDFAIAALESTYQPNFTTAFTNNNQVTLSNSQLTTSAASVDTGNMFWNTGITQNLKWGGSSFAAGFNNRRTDSSNEFATRNPSYNSSINFAFVQPILRGFKTDGVRSQLQVTQITQDISEVQLKATITNTLSNVRNAYWDYLFSIQAVEVAKQSLALADKLVDDNKTRVEIGTMAPIDVVQAEAEAATRRQTLAQVEATMRTAELALKRLIVSGTEDPIWRATLVPTDRPEFRPERVDIESAVRKALANRTDLDQARKQLQSNDVTIEGLRNAIMPSLDVSFNYGLAGLGGTQFVRQGLGSSNILQTIPGGYSQALNNIGSFDAPNWAVGVNLAYPLGNSAADAGLARARLQVQQTQAQIRALELNVATEVTNTALQVESNLKRVEAASAARELAQRRLEAEQSKFEVGMSTNYFVVQAQRDLRDSQNVELRTLLDYRKSLVDFERVQETSLSRAGITVVAGSGVTNTTARIAAGGGGGAFGGGAQ